MSATELTQEQMDELEQAELNQQLGLRDTPVDETADDENEPVLTPQEDV